MRENKKYFKLCVVFSIVVFFIGIFFGCLGPNNISSLAPEDSTFSAIFTNNIKVSLAILILGTITGGIFSQLVIFINGFIIGQLIMFMYNENLLFYLFTGLLPHVFFELFGLSLFIGISHIPLLILVRWLRKNEFHLNKNDVLFYLVIFFIGIVLIGSAALIESNISSVNL